MCKSLETSVDGLLPGGLAVDWHFSFFFIFVCLFVQPFCRPLGCEMAVGPSPRCDLSIIN